ncbi:MAG: MBL fold metallo-hydrolase [Brotaphodocola sp.]
MFVRVLSENTTNQPEYQTEHGLSFYIETGDHKILFDMGHGEIFAQNAKRCEVNLADVDIAVISHGHHDHGGGIQVFLRENETAPVYVNRHIFEPHFYKTERYNGLNPELAVNKRFVFVDDYLDLGDGMELFSCNDRKQKYDPQIVDLNTLEEGEFVPDDFRHEQYLVVQEGNKKILFCGCCHKGILNVMNWMQPDVVIGGFHLFRLDLNGSDLERLEETAQILNEYHTEYYTCHCTGTAQFEFLKKRMGERIQYLSAGDELDIS